MFTRFAQQAIASWTRAPFTRRVGSAAAIGTPLAAGLWGITASPKSNEPCPSAAETAAVAVATEDEGVAAADDPTLVAHAPAPASDNATTATSSGRYPATFKTSLPIELSDREREIRRRNGIPDRVVTGDTVLECWQALQDVSSRIRFTPWEQVQFLHLEKLLPEAMRPGTLDSVRGMRPYDYQAWFSRANVRSPRVFFDLATQERGADAPVSPLGRVIIELSADATPAAAEAMIAYCEGFTHKHRLLASYEGTYLHAAEANGAFIRGGDLRRGAGVNSILFRDQKLLAPHSVPSVPPGRGACYLLEMETLMHRTSGSLFEFDLHDAAATASAAKAATGTSSDTIRVPIGRVVEGLPHLDAAARWLNSNTDAASAATAAAAAAAAATAPAPVDSSSLSARAGAAWESFVAAMSPYVRVDRAAGSTFPGYHHRETTPYEAERRVVVQRSGLLLPPGGRGGPQDPYRECRAVLAQLPAMLEADRVKIAAFHAIVDDLIADEYQKVSDGSETSATKRARIAAYKKALDEKNTR